MEKSHHRWLVDPFLRDLRVVESEKPAIFGIFRTYHYITRVAMFQFETGVKYAFVSPCVDEISNFLIRTFKFFISRRSSSSSRSIAIETIYYIVKDNNPNYNRVKIFLLMMIIDTIRYISRIRNLSSDYKIDTSRIFQLLLLRKRD